MKYFSLIFKYVTNEYDNQVAPLLYRICNLENLTLYIKINKWNRLVDGIFIHLSKLERFIFYICTVIHANHIVTPLSNDDIQRTFSNIKFGEVGCIVSIISKIAILDTMFSRFHFYLNL